MDDQQAKELDLAWFAGFFDGEGCIELKPMGGQRLKRLGVTYYYPRLRVCNTDQATLPVVRAILDAQGLPYHVSHRDKPQKAEWSPAWDIAVVGLKRCKRWLEWLAPHLRTKQAKAYLMLEFINSRLAQDVHEGYSARETALLLQLRKGSVQLQRPHADTA